MMLFLKNLNQSQRTIAAAVAGFACIIIAAWQVPESVALRSELTAIRGKVEEANHGISVKTWREKRGVERSRCISITRFRLAGIFYDFNAKEDISSIKAETPLSKLPPVLLATDSVVVHVLKTDTSAASRRVYEIETVKGEKLYSFYDSSMKQLALFVFLLAAAVVLLVYSIRRIFGKNIPQGERVV